jgi:hypothetical protein
MKAKKTYWIFASSRVGELRNESCRDVSSRQQCGGTARTAVVVVVGDASPLPPFFNPLSQFGQSGDVVVAFIGSCAWESEVVTEGRRGEGGLNRGGRDEKKGKKEKENSPQLHLMLNTGSKLVCECRIVRQ